MQNYHGDTENTKHAAVFLHALCVSVVKTFFLLCLLNLLCLLWWILYSLETQANLSFPLSKKLLNSMPSMPPWLKLFPFVPSLSFVPFVVKFYNHKKFTQTCPSFV
jgi:hypothetical protein